MFFEDIENHFNSNIRLYAVRSIGKKYVEDVLSKSHIDKEKPNWVLYPIDWSKRFTPGEFQTILVLHLQFANVNYFTLEGIPDPAAIETLLREIEIGLWDNYLFFEYESFQNVLTTQQMLNSSVSQESSL